MQDTVLELEFQSIKKQFTMLQVKKTNLYEYETLRIEGLV